MSPKSKEQYEDIREQSKTKILLAAIEIFAEKGYPHASMDQIAKRAGVAKGSIYHYFDSKEVVLKEVVMHGLAEFEGIMKEVQTKASPSEQLEALITGSFDSIRERKDFWKLYFSLLTQMGLPQSLEEMMGPMISETFEFMTYLLQTLGFKNAEVESRVLAATMDGVFLHYLMLGNEYPLEEVKAEIIQNYIKS